MINRSLLLLLFLFLFLFRPDLCIGQSGKFFTTDNELSSSMINSVYQDRMGVIWIATEDGLNRYDGAKFTTFRHDKFDESSLIDSYVNFILEDPKANMYVGTLSGLQTYDVASDKFGYVPIRFSDGQTFGANVSCGIVRRNGDVIFGTAGHGIFKTVCVDGIIEIIQIENFIPSFLVTSLYEDRLGNLWIGTADKGLICKTASGEEMIFASLDYKSLNSVSTICEDKFGKIYFGSLKHGVIVYDPFSNGLKSAIYSGNKDLSVMSIYPISDNHMLIGTDGSGLKVLDISTLELSESDYNINVFDFTKSKVHSIMKDFSGNLWLGFYQKGVMIIPDLNHRFNYAGYKSTTTNTIGSNCVMSVYHDNNGKLWVGADSDGIYELDSDLHQNRHYRYDGSQSSVPSTILSIFRDSESNMWLGSYMQGMARFNPKTGECKYIDGLFDSNNTSVQSVYSIVEDNNKRLWIGTMGAGLFYMDMKTSEFTACRSLENGLNYRENMDVLHNKWINCLLFSSDERIYLGTYDGLGCLDLKTMSFTSAFNTNRLLKTLVVYALYEDRSGGIWAGTADGLKLIDPSNGSVKEFSTIDGLPSNSICAIQGDANGNIWISTNHGLSCYNADNDRFINYYASDGLQSNEFSKSCAFTDKRGKMYFGGINGISVFDPLMSDNVVRNPQIRISDFYINNNPVRKGMLSGGEQIISKHVMQADTFNLCYKDNSFTIEFSAMEFNSPERFSYMYSVNNDNWITLGQGLNSVSFTDIAPGTYRFNVRSAAYDSLSDIREVVIIVSPAWYASNMAKFSYIMIVFMIMMLIIWQTRQRFRSRQRMLEFIHAQQINEARLQFFMNISHEIRTPMTLIISPLKKLLATDTDPERLSGYAIMQRNAERILGLVNQLLDLRRIDKGQMQLRFREVDIVSFVRDVTSGIVFQLESKRISLDFISDKESIPLWIDTRNFDKIILNLLSNSMKFTPVDGRISINIKLNSSNSTLDIIVTDTGIGISEADKSRIFERYYQINNQVNNSNVGSGIGLHLTRSLVELHGGTITVENNEDGDGCVFTVSLPLGRDHINDQQIETLLHNDDLEISVSPGISQVEEEEERVKPKSKKRILVVEDDDEIRSYITRELSAEYYVHECVNGREALDYLLKKTPDLVISDIMMPEMDGLSLCRKIRQNININHVPVILLTAKVGDEENIEGLQTGADAYLTKPFSIDIVKTTIDSILKSRDMLRNCYSGNQNRDVKIEKFDITPVDDKLMSRIMNVITKNISNPGLSVEMIASEVGISRVHLHRKLKELTNQSTRDFIRNFRLKQAAQLLVNGQCNVTEVAEMTGFGSITIFTRAFKELYGIPPTSYVKEYKEKRIMESING